MRKMSATGVFTAGQIHQGNLSAWGAIGALLAAMREIASCFFIVAKLPPLNRAFPRLSTGTSIAESPYR